MALGTDFRAKPKKPKKRKKKFDKEKEWLLLRKRQIINKVKIKLYDHKTKYNVVLGSVWNAVLKGAS